MEVWNGNLIRKKRVVRMSRPRASKAGIHQPSIQGFAVTLQDLYIRARRGGVRKRVVNAGALSPAREGLSYRSELCTRTWREFAWRIRSITFKVKGFLSKLVR